MARATEPDEILAPPTERVVLWYRAEPGDDAQAAANHAHMVATRCEVAGGRILVRVGQTVVAIFDVIDLEDTIELGLALLAELRTADANRGAPECSIGLSVGEVRSSPGLYEGSALDRAQLLANRVRAGELVVDDTAHEQTEESHLCVRGVQADGVSGQVIDARFPLKRDCRAALAQLHEPGLPEAVITLFEHLSTLVTSPGTRRIVLESAQPYTSIEWVRRIAAAHPPALILHLGRQAGGLQPLGAWSLALRRLGAALDGIEIDEDARSTLVAIRDGAAVSRTAARTAVQALLAARPGAWLVLDRLRELDTPSLLIVAEAAKGDGSGVTIIMTVGEAEGVPSALLRSGEHERITLPPLEPSDARQVAEQVLGARAGADVARRVAQLGGDTLIGVMEAARTLVCAGDLVFADGGFRWRTSPRAASMAIPTDSLVTERIHGLEADTQRTLEALCVTPPAMGPQLVMRVARMDGLTEAEVQAGLDDLGREGWLDAHGDLGALSPVVRGAVRNAMPPARAAELHRFVADVLVEDGHGGVSFGAALLAGHLAEGGREEDAAGALLDAAQAATHSGFERMAVRLAAFALKLSDSAEMKKRARKVARTVDSRPATREESEAADAPLAPAEARSEVSAPTASTIARSAVRAAIASIVGGEPEAAEGFLDTAVAAGWGRSGAQRLWSLALLAKGDVPAAVRTFKQARRAEADDGTRGREALTAALILLESGEMLAAIRSALESLAVARTEGDHHGTRASLLVLSACYRVLGRDDEAERIEAAA